MSNILDFGKETVLEFIKTTIKTSNRVKEDILDKITYVSDEVTDGTITEDRSSQGFYYERLWDLCIKFGVTDLTKPSYIGHLQTSHIINENPNKTNIDFQKNCWSGNNLNGYLQQNVRSGNSGGYSDITFLNKFMDETDGIEKEELYFISVKYFAKEKEISKYDIGKLCTLIRDHEKKNRTIKLYIFVKDKEKAIAKFDAQHSSSNILIKYINPGGKHEHIYDINDLQGFYFKLKKILDQYNYLETPENISNFEQNYLEVLKSVFIPRFHQELFILKINKLIDNGEQNILVGAIPRSGKSYIMAGTILEYVKKQEALNPGKKLKILMMTPAPNETFGEYQSIFNNYIDFEQLGIDVITYTGDVSLKKICGNKKRHCVIIISKQKLGWKAGSKAEKLLEKDDVGEVDAVEDVDVDEDIIEKDVDVENDDEDADKDITIIKKTVTKLLGAKPDINVMFLDEAHFGMSTEKAKKIVDVLNSTIANTIKIYVTATYNKPLQTYGVKSNCKLTWDMNDIKIMQTLTKDTINDNPIKRQFGSDIYTEALEYYGDKSGETLIDKLKKEYAVYPKPYLITSLWDKEFLNFEKLKIGDTEFGWDMNKLFATTDDSDNFANVEQVKEMMRYYFGYPNKKDNYAEQSFYRTRGILPRIRNICLNECRTLQPQHKTTQLWFLPLGSGKIKNKIKALITLFTLNEFKDIKQNYHFFAAVDIEDKTKKGRTLNGITYMNNPRNIKNEIETVEKEIKDGKIKANNLIILAGQRLQLGISLRNVDIVTLWNSISSADAIFQMLFRSMTEVETPECIQHEYCDKKSFGFMVDMNPQRAFTNVELFSANITKTIDADTVQKYRQITDLINIDEDVLLDKYADNESGRNKFVADLFNKLYASWNINVENTKQIISKFSFDMTKLEALKSVFEKINTDKIKRKTDIDVKDEDDVFEPGKKKEKVGPNKQKKEKETKEKEINLNEIATELITEFISLLNIFTLYVDEGSKCILTDNNKTNNKITVIDDIDVLKNNVYKDAEQKTMFLKILNGRLTGNADEMYQVNIIDTVLDAMDNADDKQVMNKIVMSKKKQYYTINEPDKLLEYINSELTPKEKEKKENGEVFTPVWLVNEMLNKLDQSIFTNKDYRWLDPAVGIGNFPIIVYKRLMIGLMECIPDEEDRRKHILEKMLYMVEISEKSIYILNKIFCGDTYKLNIHKGSFLSGDYYTNTHGFFDVIIGNPPYNPPKTETGSSGNSIWQQFVIKSFYMINEKGFLLFIHPPGWKKPTDEIFDPNKLDILTGEYYKYDKKTGKQTIKQIRQGQVWQVLRENGNFSFIYTNDQKNKKIEDYIPFFPAVDYYVYQKNGNKTPCNTKNVFLGEIKDATGVRLNYALNYLPNLITNQSQRILHKVTTKGGDKPDFGRFRNGTGFSIDSSKGKYKYIYTYNKKSEAKYQYSDIIGDNNINLDKVIMNFDGGIDCYTIQYVKKEDKIGSYEMTMYSSVETDEEGKRIESFFKSDIVKFIFLIAQYASGKMTKNEPLVANSITIPPEGVDDYYKFFDIEGDKTYIEEILTHYYNVSKKTIPQLLENQVDSQKNIQKEIIPEQVVETPTPKKKRSLKKRSKPIMETSYSVKNIDDERVEQSTRKRVKKITKRHVNDTQSNGKNPEKKRTLKLGGKSKKTTRKYIKMH